MLRTLFAAMLMTTLAACSKPQPPDKKQPPVPQARQTQMRDAIQAPIERAKAVEAEVQQAADAQRVTIDAAGG